jgi:hypothetical protein
LTTRPEERSTASARIASCRSIASFIASGNRSQSRVLDSRSVKTNVSVSGNGSVMGRRFKLLHRSVETKSA